MHYPGQSPVSRYPEAPPIIPGVTELSPSRMMAVMQGQGQQEEEQEDTIAKVVSEAGYLFARAAEYGPDVLKMLLEIGQAVYRRVKVQTRIDMLAQQVVAPPTISPSEEMGGEDPRGALLMRLLGR